MKVPLRWLVEYVDIGLPAEELAHHLTMAGVEVEAIEWLGGDWDNVVVGNVRALEPHPNADRLSLATVDAGSGEPSVVVCGAPNIAVGQTIAFAREGARLIDAHSGNPHTLKRSSIRGVESAGMVCSDRELGISDEHEGIKVLADDAHPGTPLADVLGDTIFDFSLTPNRPDLFSVLGIAREVAALTGESVREPDRDYTATGPPAEQGTSVDIEAPDLCARYTATLVRGVTIAPSPPWLQARLEAAGSRSINNVVDITNYVMLEMGQPLHAFDFDKLQGGRIVVRRARDGERITLIDGSEHALTASNLVIADAQDAVAVAGVMGAARSEVSGATTTLLLESATFDGPNSRRTAASLKLRTEASTRFEKGLTAELALEASRRATKLLVDLCGGSADVGLVDAYPRPRLPVSTTLTHERLARVLGLELPSDQVVGPLKALGFTVGTLPDGYTVTAPYWRSDVTIADDLVEEVARIVGYDKLPSAALQGSISEAEPQPLRDTVALVRGALAAAGLAEAINYSLTSEETIVKVQPLDTIAERPPLAMRNPMSNERALLRTTLRPGLLESFAANRRRRRGAIGLFEVGRVFHPRPDDLPQERTFALALYGGARPTAPVHDSSATTAIDFFDAKAITDALAAALNLGFTYEAAADPALVEGRTAHLLAGSASIGAIGQVAPAVAARFEIQEPLYLIELDMDAVTGLTLQRGPLEFRAPSRFPVVVEDLAVVVDEGVPSADVERIITRARLVERVGLFDLYRGDQIPAGRKSLAFSIDYRAPDRTLTESEIAKARKGIIKQLERELGAAIRDA